MKYLFIGQCNKGSTSRTRYDLLQELVNSKIELIDICLVFKTTNRIYRSIGWRYYFGPLVIKINKKIEEYLTVNNDKYDVIWVDKGVFICAEQLAKLKSRTKILLHYTPDTAFFANDSRHFRRGLHLYDLLVTTKSFELNEYYKRVNKNKVLLLPQGYNPTLGCLNVDFYKKEKAITFIGLCEISRETLISCLIDQGYKVYLGGMGWRNFIKRNRYTSKLIFLGEEVWDDDYELAISNSIYALGLLSKKFPERHTTRTFEIPACGTCLITERNEEIDSFFTDDEVIKFSNQNELLKKLEFYSKNLGELGELIKKGKLRVKLDQRDYRSQLKIILCQCGIIFE